MARPLPAKETFYRVAYMDKIGWKNKYGEIETIMAKKGQ